MISRLFARRSKPQPTSRIAKVRNGRTDGEPQFCDNAICTSHYTLWNFVPKNLFEQFSKFSNAYFLFIMVLQCIPPISVTDGVPTISMPLNFVVTCNAVKDALEDRKRHNADRAENCQETTLLQTETSPSDLPANRKKSTYKHGKMHITKLLFRKGERLISKGSESEASDFMTSSAILKKERRRRKPFRPLDSPASDELFSSQSDESGTEQEVQPITSSPEVATLKQKLHRVHWEDIKVGDMLVLFSGHTVPADCVILASSDPRGSVFIETASLDGETSLKVKTAIKELQAIIYRSDDLQASQAQTETFFLNAITMDLSIECAAPIADLQAFSGVASLRRKDVPQQVWDSLLPTGDSSASGELKFPVNTSQLLLRSCRVCHTSWVIGLVVYTGKETKIQLNAAVARRKMSKVERKTHKLVLVIFILMLILSVICGVMTSLISASTKYINLRYLDLEYPRPFLTLNRRMSAEARDSNTVGIQSFFTWIILYTNMVPISLVVTMGLVKSIQAWHMSVDLGMYDKRTDTFAAVRTSDLNEELGQVSHIMTDKTGTLTANWLQFRKCSIGGKIYGDGLTDMRRKVLQMQGISVPPEPSGRNNPRGSHVKCVSEALNRAISGAEGQDLRLAAVMFMLNLASNHSVLIEETPDDVEPKTQPEYIASSPDEEALVNGARYFGITLKERRGSTLTIEILGEDYFLEVIAFFEFTSERKRSTTIVRMEAPLVKLLYGAQDIDKTKYFVFTKGADSVLVDLCITSTCLKESLEHLGVFARDCLRTLCYAYKELKAKELELWYNKYKEASLLLTDRNRALLKTTELVEVELQFQGISGIEDRLAKGVPETIDSLIRAGIKIWMLTGDQFETALNIGLASQLIPASAHQIYIVADRILARGGESLRSSLEESLSLVLESMQRTIDRAAENRDAAPTRSQSYASLRALRSLVGLGATDFEDTSGPVHNSTSQFVALFDGNLLSDCLEDPRLRVLTYGICELCRSVIFFRVAPQQKGDVVRLVRDLNQKAITLAIGDGANDCNMIQTAHVGVGIRGREGLQAFSSSDYGIADFRFLRELLLVHGRWNYRRMTKMVLHMLYKNFVFSLPVFYLAIVGLFSRQKVFTEVFSQTYNVCLTQFPVMAFGIWDQDVDRKLSVKFPQMYRAGIRDLHFRNSAVIEWTLYAFVHSAVVFWVPYHCLGHTNITSISDGLPNDFWLVSNVIFIQVMLVVNTKILLETMCPNWLTLTTYIASFASHFFLLYMQSMWPSFFPMTTGIMLRMAVQPMFWLLCIIVPTIALSFDIVRQIFCRTFEPELHHLMQFLMRFEQEERRVKKALLLEAVRQGGPQLITAMGLDPLRGDTKAQLTSSVQINRENSIKDPLVDHPLSSCADYGEREEDYAPEVDEEVVADITLALKLHEKTKAAKPTQGVGTVVLELLHIKPLFETLKGGFAFTSGDDVEISANCDALSLTHQRSGASRAPTSEISDHPPKSEQGLSAVHHQSSPSLESVKNAEEGKKSTDH